MNTLNRRKFLAKSATAGISVAAMTSGPSLMGREPFQRRGSARLNVGLAAYSFRDYFAFRKGKSIQPANDGPPMTMESFMDYCVAQGCDAAELTSYFFRPKAEAEYFLGLKKAAFLRGLAISGTAIGNNFTVGNSDRLDQEIAQTKQWIDHAAVLGAPHIRVFAGTGAELRQAPQRIDQAIDALEHCAAYAAQRGIVLGVENHGNLTSEQMLTILERVQSDWIGMNLDTGNFFSEDPYADLEKCVGYAVNVQVKVMMRAPDGKKYEADLDRVAGILRDGGYQGFVNLEFEEEHPYEHVPRALDQLRKALGT